MNMRLTDVRIEDNIAVITIQNPPVNTLSMKTMEDIHSALTEVEQQGNVKAVILTGQGQHFVAGAELNEFLQIESKEAASQMSYIGYQLMDRIESFSVPVIAAIKGACLGGGLELALACHLRVATQEAIFGLPEITLGIIPGAGGTQRLPKVIGQARAIEMILTGERISAEEAKQLGLINKVCSQEELENESLILAKRITAQGKVAIESALVSVMEGLLGSAKAGYRMEAEKFGHCFTTHDKREGVEAFLNRRKPQFQDR